MILPEPALHKTWDSWARALAASFSKVTGPTPVTLPTFAIADLPRANQDGMVVFVLDDVNGAQPVYSEGGIWRRFTDGTQTTT